MSGGMKALLFVSLAVNLLIVGAVAGGLFAGLHLARGGPAAALGERIPGPRAFMAALPGEVRAQLRDDLIQGGTETREARAAARQARVAVFEAMGAEPYDSERVRQAFAHQREADTAVAAAFHDRVAGSFARLTPEQRHAALDALRNAQAQNRPGAAGQGGPIRERLRERWQQRRQQQPPH